MGARLIVDALSRLPDLPPEVQPDEGITYAAKIDKAEARVDWSRTATEVSRQIRGLSPFPGAWCEVAGERVKLLGARVGSGRAAPGIVLSGFTIACGEGAVEVTRAQRAGKKPMEAAEVLKGLDLGKTVD